MTTATAQSYVVPLDAPSGASMVSGASSHSIVPPPTLPGRGSHAETDSSDEIPALGVHANCGVDVLTEAGRFPFLTRFVVKIMGLETAGAPMRPCPRIKHVLSSLSIYSCIGLVIWMLSRVVFGFSDAAAIAIGAIIYSLRRFWKINYKRKWQYFPVAIVALVLLIAFIALDISTLM